MQALILSIFKTHVHESLDVQRVKAIVNAIKGKANGTARVQKSIDALQNKGSIICNNGTYRLNKQAFTLPAHQKS